MENILIQECVAIETAKLEAELNVSSALLEYYSKALDMIDQYEGNDYSAFSVFLENVDESAVSTVLPEVSKTEAKLREKKDKKMALEDKARESRFMGDTLIKKILLFIPSIIRLLYKFIVEKVRYLIDFFRKMPFRLKCLRQIKAISDSWKNTVIKYKIAVEYYKAITMENETSWRNFDRKVVEFKQAVLKLKNDTIEFGKHYFSKGKSKNKQALKAEEEEAKKEKFNIVSILTEIENTISDEKIDKLVDDLRQKIHVDDGHPELRQTLMLFSNSLTSFKSSIIELPKILMSRVLGDEDEEVVSSA